MYDSRDNYIPISEDKCESCVHYHACLACCHNTKTGTTTITHTPHYNYEGGTDTDTYNYEDTHTTTRN